MDELSWRRMLRVLERGSGLQPPADPDEIASAEQQLGIQLPIDLRRLYEATNGIYDPAGQWFVMWQLGDLTTRNSEDWIGWESPARRRYLGFGDDGTGAPFCLELTGSSTVLRWSPIDQKAHPLAADLAEFWTSWLTGDLKT